MPALYFLKKQDVGRHGCDGLLDAMDARSRAHGTDAFVNIPGRDAEFHAGERCTVGRCVGRIVDGGLGLGLKGDGVEDSALTR